MTFSIPFGFEGLFPFIAGLILLFFSGIFFLKFLSIKKYAVFILLLLFFATFLNLDASPYPLTLLCAFMFYNAKINIKMLVWNVIILRTVFTVVVLLLLKEGYVSNIIFWGDNYTLGFSGNPNGTSSYFFSLTIFMYISVRLMKNKYMGFVVDIINISVLLVIFYYTGSRTFFFAGVVLYLSSLFIRPKRNIFASIGILTPFFLFALSFIMLFFYDNLFLNVLFSGRPAFYREAFDLLRPLDLLTGNSHIIAATGDGVILDSAYLMILFLSGLPGVLFFLYLYTIFTKNMLSDIKIWKKYYLYVPVVIAIAFTGFTESTLTQLRDTTIIFYVIIMSVHHFKLDGKNILDNKNQHYF